MLEGILNCKLGESAFTHGAYRFSNIIHSQPSDSVFKPMMHRSDNFFAEQTLIMASNEYLGYMSDERMIDTLLKTDLKDIPQQPAIMGFAGPSRGLRVSPTHSVRRLVRGQKPTHCHRV